MTKCHACNYFQYLYRFQQRQAWAESRYEDKKRAKSHGVINPLGVSPLLTANTRECIIGESPSANFQCSARGLAILGVPMANKGIF